MTPSIRPLRVGLIGCGRIATVHLRHLRPVPNVEIVGFCDREIAQARALRAQAGTGAVFADVADLVREPLDAVHVLTPPATHAEVAIAALERGLHVLVEKPMATTAEAARRMQEAAQRAGRILCVDHNRLFDPPIVRARQMVADGAIGTLLSVEVDQGVNVQEGGPAAAPLTMWLNLGPHPLYLLRDFIGEITEWHACGGPLGELRAVLKGTRALGTLLFSPGTAPYPNALTLHGTNGTLEIDLNTMTLVRRRERRLPRMLAKAALNVDHAVQLIAGTVRTTWRVTTRRLGTYPGIGVVIERFYGAIRNANDLPVTSADGERVVTLLEDMWAQAQRRDARAVGQRRWAAGWLPSRGAPAVLVTGAGGFLGRRVVAALRENGHHVRALIHATPPPEEWVGDELVDIVSGQLTDDDGIRHALAGAKAVIHCAARVSRRGSRDDFFRDNVSGTAHLLEAAAAAGVERFVHVSSIGVYGYHNGGEPTREATGYDPHPELRGAYTWSKVEADRVVQEFGRHGRLRTVIIRPGILVGPEGRGFTSRLALGSVLGRLLVVGRPSALLPLCHVDDAAAAVLAAITADAAQGAYNVVDDEVAQDEWLRSLAARGASKRAMFVPPLMLTIPAAALELTFRMARRPTPSLSRYKIRRATESLRYDTSRARQELGWTPAVGVRSLIDGARSTNGTRAAGGIRPPASAGRGGVS
jgi:nucleoside-diphosphate-sugar epimerase/predicted dehydrogenase